VSGWLAVACAAAASWLWAPYRPRVPHRAAPQARAPSPDGWMRRRRPLWCLLAGVGAAAFVQGTASWALGVAAAVGTWVVIGRSEPPGVRRDRERVRRDLPHLVGLLAATLRAGAAPGDGVAVVCAALPGPAADRLAGVVARLALGVDPVQVWASLEGDPALAPLGRTIGRAQSTGASVVPAVERLAHDLARRARADVEERARAVGVKAALPLGLCLLPAFLLVGIVPLVAALLDGLGT
jgi:Flp pilus assembly protein TadB